jgi:hypothetical protein
MDIPMDSEVGRRVDVEYLEDKARLASRRVQRQRPVNINTTERIASVLAGSVVALYGLRKRGAVGAALTALGAELTRRGVTGHCYAYDAVGVTSIDGYRQMVDRASQSKAGRYVADASTRATDLAVETAAKTGRKVAETGTTVGRAVADAGTKAGSYVADAGTRAGSTIVDVGTKTGRAIAETADTLGRNLQRERSRQTATGSAPLSRADGGTVEAESVSPHEASVPGQTAGDTTRFDSVERTVE